MFTTISYDFFFRIVNHQLRCLGYIPNEGGKYYWCDRAAAGSHTMGQHYCITSSFGKKDEGINFYWNLDFGRERERNELVFLSLWGACKTLHYRTTAPKVNSIPEKKLCNLVHHFNLFQLLTFFNRVASMRPTFS